MEITTFFECSCSHCGQVIEYLASNAGKVVECPNCRKKSQLPETEKLLLVEMQGPPLPTTKNCPVCGAGMKFQDTVCPVCESVRKTKIRLAWGLAAAVVLLIAVCLYIRHSRLAKTEPEVNSNQGGTMIIAQPEVRQPKSINDLRPGRFSLEQKRGSDLILAVGDIENVSENVHHGLKVDLDLLDATGAKIGSVTDYFTELGPHQTWHFLRPVTDPNAKSARFAGIKEDQ